MPPPAGLLIRALRSDDNLKKLSLGAEEYAPLKSFLRNHAVKYEDKHLARTYVLVEKPDVGSRVWGYISLVASEVKTTHQNTPSNTHWPPRYHIPAVKLARMAVDQELQGKGWGRDMINFAIGLIAGQVASQIGVRLLVTDAKASAVGFYSKVGFTALDTKTNMKRKNPLMFVPLEKLSG